VWRRWLEEISSLSLFSIEKLILERWGFYRKDLNINTEDPFEQNLYHFGTLCHAIENCGLNEPLETLGIEKMGLTYDQVQSFMDLKFWGVFFFNLY